MLLITLSLIIKKFILKYKGRVDYSQDKKYDNSINFLKPTIFEFKKRKFFKF